MKSITSAMLLLVTVTQLQEHVGRMVTAGNTVIMWVN